MRISDWSSDVCSSDLSALAALRAQLNADPRYPRVTVSHLLLKAIGNTLAGMPEINRIWLDDRELALDGVDVGLVADTPDGLRIPVVRDVAARPLDAVAAAARDRVERSEEHTSELQSLMRLSYAA